MTITDPFWLVLAIPLVMSLWIWPLPSRMLTALRCVLLVLLLAAFCGLSIFLPIRAGTVVIVADRSLSMPHDSAAQQKETLDIVHSAIGPNDKLAVVSFAETAAVEQSPDSGKITDFSCQVGSEASNLADAIDLAVSLIGRGEPGRILVLSDGRWTGRDPSASTARAAAVGLPIDYREMQRSSAGDLAVDRIQGPESVTPGESFMITAWVVSPREQQVTYELRRGNQMLAGGKQKLSAGQNRLIFRDTAAESGSSEISLRVRGDADDPVPENNTARLLVGVRGEKPVRCVTPSKHTGLPHLLKRGRLNVVASAASQCEWTLEELAGYSAVLLENTPASSIGHAGMENLAAWVSQAGGGLMLTGGKDSYGPGGYYKSPLAPIMPVSMELRREHRKLSVAIVVALDRSGSMACTVPDGRTKIQLADLATAEVLSMLSPMDQFGCIAVDTAPHEIVPLSDYDKAEKCRDDILRIDSAGGGIYIYEALVKSADMLASANAGARHIILFADAADSKQHPDGYEKIIDACIKAGVTVSVIGLGTDKDCDAALLQDVAKRGGGQCMFTNVAQELPRLFAQDTLTVARSAFLDEPVGIRAVGGLLSITHQPLGELPSIGGYNLCYLRADANLAIVSQDEYDAPILSSWMAGLGRVLCYTGEADGKYTGKIAKWKSTGDFFTSLVRWTAGKNSGLGPGIAATQELSGGACHVRLHLDPSRKATPFSSLPELVTLSAKPGDVAKTNKTRMNWESADVLSADFSIAGSETVLSTVNVPGLGHVTLAPMCLPYSPEYQPPKAGRGTVALENLAKSTGGCERLNLAAIWNDISRRPHLISLAPYLLLLAVMTLLIEVLQRRTGLLPFRWKLRHDFLRTATSAASESQPPDIARKKTGSKRVAKKQDTPETPTTAQKPSKTPVEGGGMLDAITEARNRASQRTSARSPTKDT